MCTRAVGRVRVSRSRSWCALAGCLLALLLLHHMIRDGWGPQFDPSVSEELKQEFMDEVLAMRCARRVAMPGERRDPGLSPSALDHPNIVRLLGACTVPPRMCFVMELCGQSVFHLLHATRTRLHRKQLASIAVRSLRRALSPRFCRAAGLCRPGVARPPRDRQSHDRACVSHRPPPVARRPLARRRPCAAVPARSAARRGSPGPEDAQPARRHGRTCAPVRLRPRHHPGAHRRCVCVARAARSSADLLSPAPGTPNYMAPELLRSSGTFSKQVDVYAFGVVLWEVRAPAATLLQAGPSTLGPSRSLVAACPSTATTRRRSLAKCAPASAPGSRTPRRKPPARYLRSAAAKVGASGARCSD